MSVARIASRYAKSLMDLAKEKGNIERILEDMKSLQSAVSNRDMYMMLKSPIINSGKKRQILNEIFKGKFDDITMAFTNIVLTKGREAQLPEIADEFVAQYKAYKNMSTVTVTSALPLSQNALDKIKAKIQANDPTVKNIDIITKVDASIIGGLIIEFGDKLYDSSVTRKLRLLKKEFSDNSYRNN